MALSKEDFELFFQKKKSGTYKCPFCSKEEFIVNGIMTTPPVTAKLVMSAIDDMGVHLGTHEFYSFACTNCGHTDFFHKNQIEQTLAQIAASEKPNG